MALTLEKLIVISEQGDIMDDLAKWVSELAQKFPDPIDFIREIEKTDKPDKDKGDYFFEIGDRLIKISNFKLALKVYDKALEYYLKFNNRAGEAKCYSEFGNTYKYLGDFQKAIKYHNKALRIFIEINNKAGESKCFNNLGIAYRSLGDCKKAIEYHEKSLKIATEIGNKSLESACYANLGLAYKNLSDYKKAIEYPEKSLKISLEIGDKLGESKCYQSLGSVYSDLSDNRKAIEYLEKSLKIKLEIGDKLGESACYGSLGHAYVKLGDYKKGIEYQEKSLKIKLEIGDKSGESACYECLGYAYHILGDFKKAIEFYNNLLEIAKKIGSKGAKLRSYDYLGEVYTDLKDFDKAIEYHKRALEIVEETKDVCHKKDILWNIGDAYINKEDFKEAEIYYKKTAEIIENMRRENIPNEYKRSFWKFNIPVFDNLIISDVKLSKKEDALENSEKGKGRTVYDFILGRGIEETGFKPEPLSFKEIQELAKRIQRNLVLFRVTEKGTFAFIVHPSPYSSPTKGERIREGIEGRGSREERAEFELLEFPEFTAKRLEELTVKLEAGKPIGGWIHAYSNYKSVTDRIKPLLLEEKVIEAGKVLKEAEEKWFKTMDDTLKILYDELMGKVFSRFKKGEKVVIIPNRTLNILPLHACFYEKESPSPDLSHQGRGEDSNKEQPNASGKRTAVGGKRRYLLEDYEISYAPNCNILDLCYRREKEIASPLARNDRMDGAGRRRDNLFAIANPAPPYNLAFSEWEVEEISKLFEAKEVYIKEEVKDKLLDKIADYGVIHLSTHGIYDLSSSFNSKLLLGKEVDLTLEEIFEKIRIDKSWLVSLSACESGLVDYRDIADEYIGLQTGFLYAGAPTVIASLWSVADFTTAFIMIKTYEYIFKQGLTKSEALRKAQLWLKDLTAGEAMKILKEKELELEYSVKMAAGDLMPLRIAIKSEDPESKPFAHPYYWAGFQLFGA